MPLISTSRLRDVAAPVPLQRLLCQQAMLAQSVTGFSSSDSRWTISSGMRSGFGSAPTRRDPAQIFSLRPVLIWAVKLLFFAVRFHVRPQRRVDLVLITEAPRLEPFEQIDVDVERYSLPARRTGSVGGLSESLFAAASISSSVMLRSRSQSVLPLTVLRDCVAVEVFTLMSVRPSRTDDPARLTTPSIHDGHDYPTDPSYGDAAGLAIVPAQIRLVAHGTFEHGSQIRAIDPVLAQVRQPLALVPFELHGAVGYAVASNSSRPISMRRISEVPAPISYSLASRRRRPVG
jgi:hypothetical protein